MTLHAHPARRWNRLVLGVLAAAAVCAALAWLTMARGDAQGKPVAPGPAVDHADGLAIVGETSALRRTLQVAPVDEQNIEVPLDMPAVVEADSARLVKVLPPVAGRITSLDKRLGDSVRQGDVLFRIDAPDAGQARSDAQKAQASLDLARRALERQRALGASDIAAQRDIEQAQNDFEQARSESVRATARLAQLGSGQDGVLVVRSPIDGRVVDLGAAAGAYWNDATAALMTVANLSSVFVTASVAENDLGAVSVGQAVAVSLDAYPGETVHGKVRYVGELMDPDTRRVKVRMELDNRDGRLKPGMYARATLLAKARRGIVVPLAAVVQRGFNARVYVEVQPWRFEPRVVRLGARLGEGIEVASGLKTGERIVVKDGVLLDD